MRILDTCARCLYDHQAQRTDHPEYLAEIRRLIEERGEEDTSPYMVYLFDRVYEKYFGKGPDYRQIKKEYNDLALGMEDRLYAEIQKAEDPLARALVMARIGNYIDFGAMKEVDREEFLALFDQAELRKEDQPVYESFLQACAKGKNFLLICDNCGEILLDRLFLEQLKHRFPHLQLKALVRGKEVLNDATMEDALYVGLDRVAELCTNGEGLAGTIYDRMPKEARAAFDEADIILAKGQGNYESLFGEGRHVFYTFLCKCDFFVDRFQVKRLTGMLVEEGKGK